VGPGTVFSLSIETEIKVRIENPESFCGLLVSWNAGIVSARHFEDNHVLDFPDRRLWSRQCLLRVRFAGDMGFLTFKGKPEPEGIFKSREELEIGLEDGKTALKILEQIGMQVWFRYQKYRREYVLNGVHVAVDETPIGNFAEFEGSQDAIRSLAQKIKIPESQFLGLSYYSLYLEYCEKSGTTSKFMTF
jgi:adenylate cyclase class 2